LGFTFEVKGSDLLGRIGALEVSGKILETPYMFPVVHPVSQIVPPRDLKSMGFAGLMTNSYIIYSRRREDALREGIHKLLDFDGVFMTDSGGYQVLEYGELEVGYREVAGFQTDIGSDYAVTLDRPTGYPQKRSVAGKTVDYSLKNAKATLEEFGDRDTVWVGPIQGGLYQELVRRSARSLVGAGFEFLALGSPVQVMECYMFADLVRMIMAARKAIPYSIPLHLFGAGHPLTMSLAVALGCDTFDSASYAIFARTGRYMSRSGVLTLQAMKHLPCSCPVCSKTSLKELLELDHTERTGRLSTHNLFVLREELETCKEAISEGRLWDLVEERSMSHPRLREAFAEMAKYSDELSLGTPALKERGLFVRSAEDLRRPELAIAKSKLSGAMRRSSTDALVVGTRKPSGGEGKDDTYIFHPVLGPFASELEYLYPFSQTEVAKGEINGASDDVGRALKAMGYRRVSGAGERKGNPLRSRRSRRGASPSPRSSSARSR
jgi:7-cyano-7-deazaguanine tRNA-ribosyltransferase